MFVRGWFVRGLFVKGVWFVKGVVCKGGVFCKGFCLSWVSREKWVVAKVDHLKVGVFKNKIIYVIIYGNVSIEHLRLQRNVSKLWPKMEIPP